MTTVYTCLAFSEQPGLDVIDASTGHCVCWDRMDTEEEYMQGDLYYIVNDYIQRNVEVVSRGGKITIFGMGGTARVDMPIPEALRADVAGFVRRNLDAFIELSRRYNDADCMVLGPDNASISNGVRSVNGLMVGNYPDEAYEDMAIMLGIRRGRLTEPEDVYMAVHGWDDSWVIRWRADGYYDGYDSNYFEDFDSIYEGDSRHFYPVETLDQALDAIAEIEGCDTGGRIYVENHKIEWHYKGGRR